MARPLGELSELVGFFDVPVLCAGDIFDKWNSPAELINFILDSIPDHVIFAIPGQHDLPMHNLDELERSAYFTLVAGRAITPLSERGTTIKLVEPTVSAWGFPFSVQIKHPDVFGSKNLKIAMAHQYAWVPAACYPDAPKEAMVTAGRITEEMAGYDVVIFGDNHKGFITGNKTTTVINCGTLMRRKADEIDYRPMVGLIHQSGKVTPYFLDTSKDIIERTDEPEPQEENPDLKAFLDDLVSLENTTLDFVEAVKRTLARVKPSALVRQILLGAMDKEPK